MCPKFSILICSLHQRAHYLERLKDVLKKQYPDNGSVEVLTSIDAGQMSIGDKRNLLLQKATGQFIAYIDDDDLVSHDYITRILTAVETGPDCTSLHLLMYTDGLNVQHSFHSIKYKTWYDVEEGKIPGNKIYFRNPNHLNPVKRELALQAMFPPNCNMCEDRKYSERLQPLLKTEVEISDPIYMYMVRTNKEC